MRVLVLAAVLVVPVAMVAACTSFGAGAVAEEAGIDAALEGAMESLDGGGADATEGSDAGALPDAARPDGGVVARYACGAPVVVSEHTSAVDCDRALADSGCKRDPAPEGAPCQGGSIDPEVVVCVCSGAQLRRTTCTCP